VRRAVVLVLVVIASACGSSGDESGSSCSPVTPERVVDSPLEVKDLSVEVPEATLDMNGDGKVDDVSVENGVVTVDDLELTTTSPNGVSIRTWADVNGDGDDDLLVDDGTLWLIEGGRTHGSNDVRRLGVSVPAALTSIWPGDLDGRPGGDFYVVRQNGTHTVTDVYSGRDMLRGRTRMTRLDGSPRALARLEKGGPLETVLLDAGPPSTLRFAPRRRSPLRGDLGESHRVTWVRVFDEHGKRKIALQVDRKVAVWPVPDRCEHPTD
jgi:hypothetical protein